MESFSFLFRNSIAVIIVAVLLVQFAAAHNSKPHAGEQPLSKIAIHRAVLALHENASIKATPVVLGTKVINNYLFFLLHVEISLGELINGGYY